MVQEYRSQSNFAISAWDTNIEHHEWNMLHEGKICHIVSGYCIFYRWSLSLSRPGYGGALFTGPSLDLLSLKVYKM